MKDDFFYDDEPCHLVGMARTNLVLKKVLSKLYRLHLDGANFEMSRWLFDWDSSISPAENIGINQELSALQRLENQRCIALRVEENPDYAIPDRMLGSPDFSDYVFCRDVSGQKIYKKFRDISDYMLSQQLSVAPESDSAWEYSNWAVWITSFDYEKFVALCSSIGFDPASAGSPAELSFTSISTPTISMDGHLNGTRSGKKRNEILRHTKL